MLYQAIFARLNPEAVLFVRSDSSNRRGTEAMLQLDTFEIKIEEAILVSAGGSFLQEEK
jgi:hypothetical protein